MASEPGMLLPGREVMVERLDLMIGAISAVDREPSRWPDPPQPQRRYPALYLVGIAGFDTLTALDPPGCAAAMAEVSRRLDRLVRGSDVLGYPSVGVFALAAGSVSPESAGALVARIEGAVALPLEIAGDVVSLRAFVALSFAHRDDAGEDLMVAAEHDLAQLMQT